MEDGRLQLGYVETAPSGMVRGALIGLAPLIVGGVFVIYVGLGPLNLVTLWGPLVERDASSFISALAALPGGNDFWFWFYLAFTVSSMMLPSASDRQGWLPLSILVGVVFILAVAAGAGDWMLTNLAPVVGVVFILAAVAGAGEWMLANLAPGVNDALLAMSTVFGVGVIAHLGLLPLVLVTRWVLSKLTGMKVE
jgi:hypothetical protein